MRGTSAYFPEYQDERDQQIVFLMDAESDAPRTMTCHTSITAYRAGWLCCVAQECCRVSTFGHDKPRFGPKKIIAAVIPCSMFIRLQRHATPTTTGAHISVTFDQKGCVLVTTSG